MKVTNIYSCENYFIQMLLNWPLINNNQPPNITFMKINFLALSFCFFFFTIDAQNISSEVISSAGDYSATDNGVSINWTIGEIYGETIIGEHHLTAGFQQGELLNKIDEVVMERSDSSIIDNYNTISDLQQGATNLEVIVYPNPTTDFIRLKFNDPISEELSLLIYDSTGGLKIRQSIQAGQSDISLLAISDLSAGVYYIKLFDSEKERETIPFVKQ